MKSILLASVATVALAGAAAAEITWSGTGSVSVGRTGSVAAVAGRLSDAQIISLAGSAGVAASVDTAAEAAAWWAAATAAQKKTAVDAWIAANPLLKANEVEVINARIAALTAWKAAHDWKGSASATAAVGNVFAAVSGGYEIAAIAYGSSKGATWTNVDTQLAALKLKMLNHTNAAGAAAAAAGDTTMTATGTLTAAMTVGDGYVASLSFNAGTGAFGAISLATPDMGTLTFSPNAIAAAVDASDKGGDLKYTNTVGGWALAVTLDVDEDADEAGSAADARNGVAAVASDSQWSVSASGTVSEGTTASLAFDEEGGYSMGVATSLAGLDLSIGTSSTAAAGTVNTMGIGYTMGEVSIGVDYSDEDADNTYTLSLGYAMDGTAFSLAYQENADYDLSVSTSVAGFAVKLATDEDAAWSLSASTPIGNAGTLSASTNSADAMSLTAAFKF